MSYRRKKSGFLKMLSLFIFKDFLGLIFSFNGSAGGVKIARFRKMAFSDVFWDFEPCQRLAVFARQSAVRGRTAAPAWLPEISFARNTGPELTTFFAVGLVERQQREAMADVLFVARMDVIQIVRQIRGHNHAGVFDLPRGARLQRPEFRQHFRRIRAPDFAAVVFERRDLHKIEREISLAPDLPPAADQRAILSA